MFIGSRELAVCVSIGGKHTWIPRSVVAGTKAGPDGTTGQDEITVEEWWAKQERLI